MKSLLGMLVIVGLSNVVFYSTFDSGQLLRAFFQFIFCLSLLGFLVFRFYDELIGFFGKSRVQ